MKNQIRGVLASIRGHPNLYKGEGSNDTGEEDREKEQKVDAHESQNDSEDAQHSRHSNRKQ